jgi:stage IV sporulation protein FB
MLVTTQRTPYDLNFRIFGIPTRVHPSFWLIAVIFSWPLSADGLQFVLLGIACMFVTIMVHELGHALMWRAYHMDSAILLYSFGGLTFPEGRLPRRSWRIIVTLAGPFANFLLFGVIWGSDQVQPWQSTNLYTDVVFDVLVQINLGWGLLNLLPVYPLDGGQISRELWLEYQPSMGVVNSLRMSMIVAIAFSAYAVGCRYDLIPRQWTVWWLRPGMYAAILFAVLALENYFDLQNQQRSRFYSNEDQPPWKRWD